MVYLELSKNYINKHYNSNKKEAIKAKDGIIFDDEKVENAFSDGWSGFFRYMNDNRQYCYFIKL
jgi:hypothetical protein